jgi:hypothetical protein
MQELAATQKRLEEPQASRVRKARRVWDFLGQAEATLVPLGFSPLHSKLLHRRLVSCSHCLTGGGMCPGRGFGRAHADVLLKLGPSGLYRVGGTRGHRGD